MQHNCLENISLLHSRIGRQQTRFLTRTAQMNPRVGACIWKLRTAFSRSPAKPNAGKEQDQGTACREQDQERRWEHEPRYDGPASRQTCSKVTVGRAGLRTPEASLQQCFYAPRLAIPGNPALRRADYAGSGWGLDAGAAQCPAAVYADAEGLGAVFEAFHSLRYVAGSARKISSSPWRSTSPVI